MTKSWQERAIESKIKAELFQRREKIKKLSGGCAVKIGEVTYPLNQKPLVWNLYYTNDKNHESLIVEYHRDCDLVVGDKADIVGQKDLRTPRADIDVNSVNYTYTKSLGSSRFMLRDDKRDSRFNELQFQFRFDMGKTMAVRFYEGTTMYMNIEKFWHELSTQGKVEVESKLGEMVNSTTEHELVFAQKELVLHLNWLDKMISQRPENFL